jgi:hypothetical protein
MPSIKETWFGVIRPLLVRLRVAGESDPVQPLNSSLKNPKSITTPFDRLMSQSRLHEKAWESSAAGDFRKKTCASAQVGARSVRKRTENSPINTSGILIVVFGRNASGKTQGNEPKCNQLLFSLSVTTPAGKKTCASAQAGVIKWST